MGTLTRILLRKLLAVVVQRACPPTVPRVGGGAEAIDCFTTFLPRGEDPEGVVLLSTDGIVVNGLAYDGDHYATEYSVSIADIEPNTLRVTHYYGVSEIAYTGLWALALGLTFRIPYARIWLWRAWHAIAQRLFNTRSLASCDRLELLRSVIDAYTSGEDPVSAMHLLSSWYGDRWAGHPRWQSHLDELERMLKMLAASGELTEFDLGFRPTGMALRAVDEAEDADRKHKANFRIQILLAIVAVVGLIMAAAQAGLFKLPQLFDASVWLK